MLLCHCSATRPTVGPTRYVMYDRSDNTGMNSVLPGTVEGTWYHLLQAYLGSGCIIGPLNTHVGYIALYWATG